MTTCKNRAWQAAQSLLICKQGVVGSSPIISTHNRPGQRPPAARRPGPSDLARLVRATSVPLGPSVGGCGGRLAAAWTSSSRQQEGADHDRGQRQLRRNLTDDPEVRYTEAGIARAVFRVAVSGRREQEASFFTAIVWRDQAEHAAESLSKGSRVVVVGRLQQRSWTAEDGGARSVVEVVAEELGPSLRWATVTATRATRSQDQ
jgi:single-strand DNA-binding protein